MMTLESKEGIIKLQVRGNYIAVRIVGGDGTYAETLLTSEERDCLVRLLAGAEIPPPDVVWTDNSAGA